MNFGSAFRAVADVLDEFEAAGFDIVDARSRDADGRVAVEFSASVPAPDRIEGGDGVEVTVEDATVADDGRVTVDLSASVAVGDDASTSTESGERTSAQSGGDEDDAPAATEPADETGDGNEVANATRETAVDDESSGTTRADDEEEGGLPPHRDPVKLRRVYREYDTFADMTEALDVDVTPQTVRRYMIEHGIHEPSSTGGGDESDEGESTESARSDADTRSDDRPDRDSSRDEDPTDESAGTGESDRDRTESTVADGIDLPGGADLEELKRAVQSSRTVYEVSRSLGIERERTRRLLDELDLLDLVTGRIAREHEVTAEEVDRRVERAAPGSA